MANEKIVAKTVNDESVSLFAELLTAVQFDAKDIYQRAQMHQLGHLMLIALETELLSESSKEVEFLNKEMASLLNYGSVDIDERLHIFNKLKEHDNDPLKVIEYAGAAISGCRKADKKFNDYFIEQVREALERYLRRSGENFSIYITCVNTLKKMRPLNSELIMNCMQKANLSDPKRKPELISIYVQLGKFSKDEQQTRFIENAVDLSFDLKEFVTIDKPPLSETYWRIINYYNTYSHAKWYIERQEYDVAESLFRHADPIVRINEISNLIVEDRFEDERIWKFIKWLFTLLMQEELKKDNGLIKNLVESWRPHYYQSWERPVLPPKIVELLKDLAKEYKLSHIITDLDKQLLKKNKQTSSPVACKEELKTGGGGYLHDYAPIKEPVLLGASAPQAVEKGREFTARFVAYIASLESEVEKKLKRLSPSSTSQLGVKKCNWQKGTKVKVKLYGSNISVSPAEDNFIWEGDMNIIDFDVSIQDDSPTTTTVLKFDVFIDAFLVAKLRVDLQIVDKPTEESIRVTKTKPMTTAFASYCYARSPESAGPRFRNAKKRCRCFS